MTEIPQIVLPHGGYQNLIVYKKSDIVYEGTVMFCRRFLPPYGDRTVDQMVQAARSCKQNIAEGSAELQAEHSRGQRGERHEQGDRDQTNERCTFHF